jgi:hypothetical protein
MRRAILFVVIAVLALLALPSLGIGQTNTHGGAPSDVFMTNQLEGTCNVEEVKKHAVDLLPTAVSVAEQSHVLAYFTATLSHYERQAALLLELRIAPAGLAPIASSQQWIERGGRGHSTVTVMWQFADIAPGDYTVALNTHMGTPLYGGGGANLQACALTVFVMPVAA